ncbi:MAG TPA: hypothetical protein VEJ44_07350 [Acidimicrobiales bacterium]|nr:hypothetical protein [Acidimicrobiales bacterium]
MPVEHSTAPATDASARWYEVAGRSVVVRAEEPEVSDLVDGRFRALRSDQRPRADITVDIRRTGSRTPWPPAPRGGRSPVYDAPEGHIDYFAGPDVLFVDYEQRARLRCAPARGVIELGIADTDPSADTLATHPLLTVALLETMKRHLRFPVHAACVALDGRGLLVAGPSGAGKSTLATALVRAGFGFLSDDLVFLELDGDHLTAHAFPDEVDLGQTSVAMFSELEALAGRQLRPGRQKHGFRIEDVFDVVPLATCRPTVLVTPSVDGGSDTRIDRRPPAEILLELVPNVLLTEPVATQLHLDALAALSRGVPSFSVRVGHDLDTAADRLKDLLGEV